MPAPKSKRSVAAPRHPEKKYGPFHGGVGVAVWLNEIQTDAGPRFYRSVSIQPRSYLDKKTGDWMDAGSLRSTDLPALILSLEAAHRFMATTPLPGQPVEEEQLEEVPPSDNGTIPF